MSAKNSSFFIEPELPDVVAKIVIAESTLKKLLFSGEIIVAANGTITVILIISETAVLFPLSVPFAVSA